MSTSLVELLKLLYNTEHPVNKNAFKDIQKNINYIKYHDAVCNGSITPKEFRTLIFEDEKYYKLLNALNSENPTIQSLVEQLLVAIEIDK